MAALKRDGLRFRNEMETGPGGRQVQIEDPDSNPIELFEPARYSALGTRWTEAINDAETAAANRAMDAMMTMKRIDIAKIQAARARAVRPA